MKDVLVKAGERRRILHLISDSIPQRVRFSAVPADGAGEPGGRVEVVGSRWLVRKPPQSLPLQAYNVVRKGFFDSLFSVFVIPDRDVRITLESRHFTAKALLLTLAAVVVLALVAAAGALFTG